VVADAQTALSARRMRYQGKISNWKDDQGFGFVIPNGGGEKAFVHISAFSTRSQRPTTGDLITYETAIDNKRRIRAHKVRFVGERVTTPDSSRTGTLSGAFATSFFCFLLLAGFAGRLPFSVAGLYLATSIVAFLAYALDKSAARTNQWRIKESTLHLLALIGGWPGALIAQKTLRHKSRKRESQTVFRITVILNCGALGWLFTESGTAFVERLIGSIVS